MVAATVEPVDTFLSRINPGNGGHRLKGREKALYPPKGVEFRLDRGISCLTTRSLTPDHHNVHRLQDLRRFCQGYL